eukprot:CAMPEP_0178911792 /NCGR_PEP_ID=MMETSP0786-20121207/9897_1 /TAXON_ID=186022 /ORGANISM="Thalassionema frauenfeldii, Strain CCMP 1798" /LENGTH=63 /DNA_ID=CAMNT_0020584289 /DNA_START=112 /DNA_END=303 /DNA_ORIENTATION=-
MGKSKKQKEDIAFQLNKKDQKKVDKLEAQIPYHEARKETEHIEKLRKQIDGIWEKAKAKEMAM